jgi:hypothetical protein
VNEVSEKVAKKTRKKFTGGGPLLDERTELTADELKVRLKVNDCRSKI